jgi:leucyl aminopeptidase
VGSHAFTITCLAQKSIEGKNQEPLADVFILPVFQDLASPALAQWEGLFQGGIKSIAADEGFDGKRGSCLVLRKHPQDKAPVQRLVLCGLGNPKKLTPLGWEEALSKAITTAKQYQALSSLAVDLNPVLGVLTSEATVVNAVDAAYQATYQSLEVADKNKKDSKKKTAALKSVVLISDKAKLNAVSALLPQAESMAKARSLAKDLVNHPANLKNTQTLVKVAKQLSKLPGLTVKIVDDVEWIEKEMPCFFEVAKGSVISDPPKFIQVRYKHPSSKAKIRRRVGLIGKSVIFDTGGYQVKPGDFMLTMKGDMTGGALVLATMQALSEIQPEGVEVTAMLAATPNKIDSGAMLPDAIVNTTCGKKVEIRHTDAEGRLTLIDAVAKMVDSAKGDQSIEEIITIATLTGSASRAVGRHIAVMANDEALRSRVVAAGALYGEPMQTLDVIEQDYEDIKSKLDGADIINTSHNKNRGAQSAAAFVMSGAPETMPICHLDIAGADMTHDEKATGIGQKLLIQFVLNAK